MPRFIDHDARRDDIARAAWQVLAREGADRLTMRNIAAEAGFSHSALARYFPDKESLLLAAFERTQQLANADIGAATEAKRGLRALRALCIRVLPVGDQGTLHARVALAFWSHAAQNQTFGERQREQATAWRARLMAHLREAESDGELDPGIDLVTASDQIAVANLGWQTQRLLMPEFATDERMIAALDALLTGLCLVDARGASRPAPRYSSAAQHSD